MKDWLEQFPAIQSARINGQHYLDSAAMTQTPVACSTALHNWYTNVHSNVHRSFYAEADKTTEQYESARQAVQQFINAQHANEVVFTKNCTEAMNLFAQSWGTANLQTGDTIAITIAEHHSSIVPWQKVAERTGCTIAWIPVTPEGYSDQQALEELLQSGTVKAVVHTGLSNVLGVINNTAAITTLAHNYGALSIVDAAQLITHSSIDVQEIDCDALVCSGYKFYGPTGIGILYAKQTLLEAMPSFLGGGMMIEEVNTNEYTDAQIPHRFEAGTPPIAAAIALKATINWLESVDRKAVYTHEAELLQALQTELQAIDEIRILGSAQVRSNCVSFTHQNIHAHDLADLLGQAGIAVRAGNHCAQPLHAHLHCTASVRASVGMYTNYEDIAALVSALTTILAKL